MAVVIDAFKSKAGRTLPHVCDEIADIVPTHAYGYAAPTIVAVCGVPGVRAALHHIPPRLIGAVSALSMCTQMRPTSCWAVSAGKRHTRRKAAAVKYLFTPAVTTTKPAGAAIMGRSPLYNCPPAEAPVCDIDELGHRKRLHAFGVKWRARCLQHRPAAHCSTH